MAVNRESGLLAKDHDPPKSLSAIPTQGFFKGLGSRNLSAITKVPVFSLRVRVPLDHL
jgi:hypothetical protein